MRKLLPSLFACSLLLLASWHSLNLEVNKTPLMDSGVFRSVAYHLDGGSRLYVDIWDHKPPVVHWINLFAKRFSDTQSKGLALLERLFAITRALSFFCIIFIITGDCAVAFYATLVLTALFFSPCIFEGGNLTEEYGTTFYILGLLALLLPRSHGRSKVGLLADFVSGCCFALACWTKEPFAIPTAITFIHLLWWNRGKAARERPHCPWSFALGVAGISLCVLVAVSIPSGGFEGWLDATSFSLFYVTGARLSMPNRLLLCLRTCARLILIRSFFLSLMSFVGFLALFDRTFRQTTKGHSMFFLSLFLGDLASASLSGRFYGHYFQQILPSFVLMASLGFLWLRDKSSLTKVTRRPALIALVVIALVASDTGIYVDLLHRFGGHPPNRQAEDLVRYVQENTSPEDPIWITDSSTWIYAATSRRSPSKFLTACPQWFSDSWLSTGKQKRERLMSRLNESKPLLIIGQNETALASFEDVGLGAWLTENYESSSLGHFLIHRRRGRNWSPLETQDVDGAAYH